MLEEGFILNVNSVRLRQETQSDGQNLYLKSHQNVWNIFAKIDDFGAKGVPKSIKMVPRRAPKVILGSKSVLGHQKLPTPGARHTLWHRLAAILGTAGRHGCAKIKQLWHQDAPKSQNMTSRMRHQKKLKFKSNFVWKT